MSDLKPSNLRVNIEGAGGDVLCSDDRCPCDYGETAIGQIPRTTESDGVIITITFPGFTAEWLADVARNHLSMQGIEA